MNNQMRVSVRLPKALIRRIERVAQAEGSTVSQVVRTATINELNRRKVA